MGRLPYYKRRTKREPDHPAGFSDLSDQLIAEVPAVVAHPSTVGVTGDDRPFGNRDDIVDSLIVEVGHVDKDLQFLHPLDDLMPEGLESPFLIVGKTKLVFPIPPDCHQAHSP